MTQIRLLSLNIWDLPITLPFTDRGRRLAALLARLPGERADIVLLQEAFRHTFRRLLVERLAGMHADAMLHHVRRTGGLTMDASGGLTTFSRWPMRESLFVPSRRVPGMKIDERIGRKGWLWTPLETPQGIVHVANVHLYAGNAPRDARIRALQVRQMLRSVPPTGPVVIAGDFNMAAEYERPDTGPTGFDLLRAAGFREVADGRSDGVATMAPSRNRWARYLPWHRPDRRLTQVFLRGPFTVTAPVRLTLHDPPVSDHYGLLVELAIAPA